MVYLSKWWRNRWWNYVIYDLSTIIYLIPQLLLPSTQTLSLDPEWHWGKYQTNGSFLSYVVFNAFSFGKQSFVNKIVSLLKRNETDARYFGSPECISYFFIDNPKERRCSKKKKIPFNIFIDIQRDCIYSFLLQNLLKKLGEDLKVFKNILVSVFLHTGNSGKYRTCIICRMKLRCILHEDKVRMLYSFSIKYTCWECLIWRTMEVFQYG